MTGEDHAALRTGHKHDPGRGRCLLVLAAVREPEYPPRLHVIGRLRKQAAWNPSHRLDELVTELEELVPYRPRQPRPDYLGFAVSLRLEAFLPADEATVSILTEIACRIASPPFCPNWPTKRSSPWTPARPASGPPGTSPTAATAGCSARSPGRPRPTPRRARSPRQRTVGHQAVPGRMQQPTRLPTLRSHTRHKISG